MFLLTGEEIGQHEDCDPGTMDLIYDPRGIAQAQLKGVVRELLKVGEVVQADHRIMYTSFVIDLNDWQQLRKEAGL